MRESRMPQALGPLVLCSLLLVTACEPPGGGGTDSGNAFRAALTVQGEGDAITSARGVAEITLASLVLEKIEFKKCADSEGEDDEIDYEGPFDVDLLTGLTLGEIDLGFDAICGLELETEDHTGFTVVVEGTTTAGVPFRVENEFEFEVEVEGEEDLTESLNAFVLLFDVDAWFANADPDTGTVDNGEILISATSNADLLSTFQSDFVTSARLALEAAL